MSRSATIGPTPSGKTASQQLWFDWTMVVFTTWMVGGLFLDGWAHLHVPGLETFFTPWHAVLYSGLLVTFGFLGMAFVRALRRGAAWRNALPAGYFPSLVGTLIFAASGFFDMLWHLAFGIEESIDALLSPSHLGLALGFVLVLSGPLRSALAHLAPDAPARWRTHLPVIVSTCWVLSVLGFFTQYAHPLVEPLATVASSSTSGGNASLYLHRSGSNLFSRVATGLTGEHGRPAFSPDGTTIAFSSATAGDHDLYLMDADGTNVRRLTETAADEIHPAWSPDGRFLAYIAAEGHFGDIRLLEPFAAMENGAASQSAATAMREFPAIAAGTVDVFGTLAWSPDGTEIMYTGFADGHHRLFVVGVTHAVGASSGAEVAATPPRRLIDPPVTVEEAQGSWSPSGDRIAFASLGGGNADIFVIDAQDHARTSRLTSSPHLEDFPVWLPDGERIGYSSRSSGAGDVFVVDLATGAQTNVTANPGLRDSRATWSADGTWMAYLSSPADVSSGTAFSPVELLQGLGVASILLQTTILMGGLLFLLRRWTVPIGASTVLLGLNGALFVLLAGEPSRIVGALAAGIVADVWMGLYGRRSGLGGYPPLFPFVIPVLYTAGYFVVLGVTSGVAWPIELWLGATVLAGACGWLIHFVMDVQARVARPDPRAPIESH